MTGGERTILARLRQLQSWVSEGTLASELADRDGLELSDGELLDALWPLQADGLIDCYLSVQVTDKGRAAA